MKHSSKVGATTLLRTSTVCLAYLIGLLANDLVFDFLATPLAAKVYYCQLIDSFSNLFGFLRVFLPCFVTGICQLVVCARTVDSEIRRILQYVLSLLVFLGVPLMAVSLSLCISECSSSASADLGHMDLLRVVHMLMLLVLVFSISRTIG